MANKEIMLGNAAIARGAYEAGVKVSAAYPAPRVQRSVKTSLSIPKYMRNGHLTKRLPPRLPSVRQWRECVQCAR